LHTPGSFPRAGSLAPGEGELRQAFEELERGTFLKESKDRK
jgi:hypothetical protein